MNLTLQSLAVGSATISPTFDPDTLVYNAEYPVPADISQEYEYTVVLPVQAVPKDARCGVALFLRTSPTEDYELVEIIDGTISINQHNVTMQNGKILYIYVVKPDGTYTTRYTVVVYGVQ